MEIRFSAPDFGEFGNKMSRASVALPREMQTALGEAGEAGIALAQGFAPVDKGDLRDSIVLTFGPTMEKVAYGTGLIYAWMREKGGVIVGNPWLVFQVAGRWVKVHQVNQSGSHYMQKSANALRPKLRGFFATAVRRAMGRG